MEKQVAIGFAKSIVIPAARGWSHKHQGIFVYESPSRRKMLSSVIQFFKSSTPDDSARIEDIITIIKKMPEFYSWTASRSNRRIRAHLEKIKEYREKIRAERLR